MVHCPSCAMSPLISTAAKSIAPPTSVLFYRGSFTFKTATCGVGMLESIPSRSMPMRQIRSLLGAVLALGFVACDRPEPVAPSLQASVDVLADRGSAVGSGQYSINGLIVDFAFDAEQKHGDKAVGTFSVYTDEGDGLIVDFTGIVTCLAIDEVNDRAWIGGVVQNNRSTDPAFDTPIHRPGHDI